jgi:hypothetical protein
MPEHQLTGLLGNGFELVDLEGQSYWAFPHSIWKYHDQLRRLRVGHSYDYSRAVIWVPEEGLNEGFVRRVIFQEPQLGGQWKPVHPSSYVGNQLFPGIENSISVAGIYWEESLSELRALVPLSLGVPGVPPDNLSAGEAKRFAEVPPLNDLSGREVDNLSQALWARLNPPASASGLKPKILLGTIVFLFATDIYTGALFSVEREIPVYSGEKVTVDSWLESILGRYGAEIVSLFEGGIPGEIFFERYRSWASSDGMYVSQDSDYLNGLDSDIRTIDVRPPH